MTGLPLSCSIRKWRPWRALMQTSPALKASALPVLAGLGLVQVQPTRPKMFAALPSEVVVGRIIEIARDRSERFAAQASKLQATFTGLQSHVRGRHPFVDLALGVEGHIRRHLVPLAAARKRILSYLEAGD